MKEGGVVATRLLDSSGVPDLQRNSLSGLRGDVFRALANTGFNWKQNGGLSTLCESDRTAADNYFDQLDEHGAFVVREGELEAWLGMTASGGHGPTWLIPMFEAMGEDPDEDGYVTPTTGDVWAFIDKVALWLRNPRRKGIPA